MSKAKNKTERQVQVLVDCLGVEKLLAYSIPEEMSIGIGDILTVPFKNRYVGAIAVSINTSNPECEDEDDTYELKPVYAVINTGLFPNHYWEVLTRIANYYRISLLQTVKTALPPKLLDQSSYRIKINYGVITEKPLPPSAQAVWQFLQDRGDKKDTISRRYIHQKLPKQASAGLRSLLSLGYLSTCLEPPAIPQPRFENIVTLLETECEQVNNRQREVLLILQQAGGELVQSELIKTAKTTLGSLKTLAQKGCIVIHQREYLRLGGKMHQVVADRPKALTPAQNGALESITSLLGKAQTLLLYGVTGSGKTEVYLQAIASVLAQRKSALVLVPEIGLTPQLTDRFRARFGDRLVNVYHSRLSDGERFDTWRQMLWGEAQVVIGTRSAVFAPLHNLGIIILDEEHDTSFKQDLIPPCYHARTVAEWRSQLEQCPLVLGSATPSAEALYGVSQGNVINLSLPERIGNKAMPPIKIVDMREELKASNRSIFSKALQTALIQMQEQKKQGILFIHRRGYSTFVSCRSCGYVMDCPRCDISLSFHDASMHRGAEQLKKGSLVCHYCNFSEAKPDFCPSCGSPYFKHFGSGTQRIEQEIAALFPELRIIRFDSDSTRNKNQHQQLLEKFQSGEADLLIGTQMLTKGLDIPQVTLVGVISADGLLNFSDFRASERAFQILTQVAGRAGRGEEPGEVIIQTYNPEHRVIEAVQNYQGKEFMAIELEARAALNYPPIGQLALIRLSSENSVTVADVATELGDYLRSSASGSKSWEVLGAAPASVTRVNDRYRWQILLKFKQDILPHVPNLEDLKRLGFAKLVKVVIDVDPLTIL